MKINSNRNIKKSKNYHQKSTKFRSAAFRINRYPAPEMVQKRFLKNTLIKNKLLHFWFWEQGRLLLISSIS